MKFRLAPKSKLEYTLDITGAVGLQEIALVLGQFPICRYYLQCPVETLESEEMNMLDCWNAKCSEPF